ncbi:hypothetical protein Btru_051677 [Bulinus truncatus]|nr:hypothetical protein Btru_051677 [Bulinus truncatus]
MTEEKSHSSDQCIPSYFTKPSQEAYGHKIFCFPGIDDPVAHLEKTRKFPIRDDDVIIAAFPKCGTHWLWEVTQMLLRQTTEYEKRTKEQVMLETPGGLDRAEQELSPRILNSHNVMAHLPQEIISKKTKIIHVIRNPKDVITSYYWHIKSMFGLEDFSFEMWVNAILGGHLSIPTQFEYLNQMSEFEQRHPDHPIKHVYFEEMKKDPVKTVKDLARFLNVSASNELCTNIVNACSFEQMKEIEQAGAKDFPEPLAEMHKSVTFYRKDKLEIGKIISQSR